MAAAPFPWEGHPAAPALTAIFMHAFADVRKAPHTRVWGQDVGLTRAVRLTTPRLHKEIFKLAHIGSSVDAELAEVGYKTYRLLGEQIERNTTYMEVWAAMATVILEPALGSLFDYTTTHASIRATVLMLDDDERNLLLPALRAMRGFEL